MVGLIEDVERVVPMGFPGEGLSVLVAASTPAAPVSAALAGAEYERLMHGIVAGRPQIDLTAEARLLRFQVEASSRGLLRSAHDVGPGGQGGGRSSDRFPR